MLPSRGTHHEAATCTRLFPPLRCLTLLESTADLVDIVEVGTPLVLSEGVRAVREITAAFPRLTVLADFKIMDAGELEASLAFEAGADIVTVLGAAEDVTIRKACEAARTAGAQVMVDLIAVADPVRRMKEIIPVGPSWFCCHAAYDTQEAGGNPLADLAALRAASAEAGSPLPGGSRRRDCPPLLPVRAGNRDRGRIRGPGRGPAGGAARHPRRHAVTSNTPFQRGGFTPCSAVKLRSILRDGSLLPSLFSRSSSTSCFKSSSACCRRPRFHPVVRALAETMAVAVCAVPLAYYFYMRPVFLFLTERRRSRGRARARAKCTTGSSPS